MSQINIRKDRSERVNYDYSDFPIYVRQATLAIFPNYMAENHWHDDIELIYMISGHMLYNVNGKIITMQEGEGILVNAKQLHYGFNEDKTDCTYICILFHPMIVCNIKNFEPTFIDPVLNSHIPYIHLSPTVAWQKNILQYIQEINAQKDKLSSPLNSCGFIYLLWNEIFTNIESLDKEGTRKDSDARLTTLKTMITYIHEHYTEKLSLSDIANAGFISKRTCGNLFLQYLHQSPMEFLIEYRLRRSIDLLKVSHLTILDISLAIGFSGASFYTETFKKHFGITPTEYRKQLLKK